MKIKEYRYPKWVDTRKRKRQFNDLSGQSFGRLTVLYRSTDEMMSNGNTTPRYACICECGVQILVRATSLKNGHTTSCRSCNNKTSLLGKNLEDLTGQVFNRWTVIKRGKGKKEPRGRYATTWLCRCECGTEKEIRAGSLKGGTTFSCGCYKHDSLAVYRNLIGSKFGLWTVISKSQSNYVSPINGRWYHTWSCLCECGSLRDVVEQSLLKGTSTSCGCTTEPLLESYVKRYLDDLGVKYNQQVKFEALRGAGGGLLSYDFGVYSSDGTLIALIECQGLQHYKPIDFFGGVDVFERQIEHDNLKSEYAAKINVPLLLIDYTHNTPVLVFKKLNGLLKLIVLISD